MMTRGPSRRLGLGDRCDLCTEAKRLFVAGHHPRLVLAQRARLAVFNSLDSHFCIEALLEAIDRHETLKIFNSDQGVQFTSETFTRVSSNTAFASAWMARAAIRTLDLSSGGGEPSNTSVCIFKSSRMAGPCDRD